MDIGKPIYTLSKNGLGKSIMNDTNNNATNIINETISLPNDLDIDTINAYSITSNNIKSNSDITIDGHIMCNNSNNSIDATTGSIITAGGIGCKQNIYCDADVSAHSFLTISDKRYKENIKFNNLGLEFVKQINPVSFNFKNDNKRHIGFIAQDIKKKLNNKNIIYEKINNKYLVNYNELIPPLYNAIKTLENRISILEQIILSNDNQKNVCMEN